MSAKAVRQERILELVRGGSVRNQEELVRRLKRAGVSCGQASVSRDVRELGLVKQDGRYALPGSGVGDLEVRQGTVSAFLEGVEMVGQNLVVVRMLPGTAHSLAVFLDHGGWPGIAGTVAGDDTIFIAVRNRTAGRKVARRIRKMMET